MITKEEFESLFDESITKKNYDDIIERINARFGDICAVFVKRDRHRGWFDYGNCEYDSESSNGFFDPNEFKEFISIGGECIEVPEPYFDGFPTYWLWSDFEKEMKETISEHKRQIKESKKKDKEKKQDRAKTVKALKASIKSKLSPDELKIILFKEN